MAGVDSCCGRSWTHVHRRHDVGLRPLGEEVTHYEDIVAKLNALHNDMSDRFDHLEKRVEELEDWKLRAVLRSSTAGGFLGALLATFLELYKLFN